jgi:hypothetical protein
VRYPHPYNSSLQGAKANRANGGNMKIEKYLNKLKEAEDYFANEYGYEIVILDEDLLQKVFSMVEKIREKITLKYYNSVTTELCFDLEGKDTLFITIVRRYKSLVSGSFIKFYSPTKGNEISVSILFSKKNVYTSDLLDRDIRVVKEILNFHEIENYKQKSTSYAEVIEFSAPIEGKVIKYII